MSNTIYLYLKTHNKTGLKYLGKTVKDPHQYNGSGVYWKNHLAKHGHDIKTEILFESTDEKKFREVAMKYSKDWDIVNSSEFANMMVEQGQGGVNSGSFKKGHKSWNKGVSMTPEAKARLQEGRRKYQDEWHLYNVKKVRVGTWTPPADNTSLLNKTRLTCPHCNKEGNVGNMKRWHFDNCGKKQLAPRGKDGKWISSNSK